MVERTPNKSCFPNDDGLDTLVKYFTRLGYLGENHPIIGDYHGYLESNPEDTFTVSIQRRLMSWQDPTTEYKSFFVFNINKGCMDSDYYGTVKITPAYRALYLNGRADLDEGCLRVDGHVFANSDFNQVTIPFSYLDTNSVWPNYVYIYDTFYGIRK